MKSKPRKFLHFAHDLLFKNVHSRQLIYNTCWEDPRIDRELMEIDSTSKIVVITSAGCNTLDYLLDSPAEIHAIDINPRQNALLELKMAFYKAGHYEDFWKFFGLGYHKNFKKVYEHIKPGISQTHIPYWTKNISYFSPGGPKKSFYYRGTAGTAAWIFNNYILDTKKETRNKIYALFEADNINDQKKIYDEIESKLWNFLMSWFVKQPLVMAMLGVPRPQIKLILDGHPEGLLGYVKDKMRQVFTEIPILDNYFWRVYLHGSYSEKCHPNYLDKKNFSFYNEKNNVIKTHSSTITAFLQKNPANYSHYVLLDHQDWMAHHSPEALEEEWKLIISNSRPGTKILFRSAGFNADFVPSNILNYLEFHDERSKMLHRKDRVGTYGSLHFAEVK
jgi:S-adenosylmethionine-diacylglycerol 3-amino-3-carboxypropyl transferase